MTKENYEDLKTWFVYLSGVCAGVFMSLFTFLILK